MLDLKRTKFDYQKDRLVTTGNTVDDEGNCLVHILQDSVQKVQNSAGAAEVLVGFSTSTNLTPTTTTEVEEVEVPAASPYTVTLRFGNVVAGEHFGTNLTEGQDLTENAAVGDNQYSIVDATGVVTFHSGEAGDTVYFAYRRDLTAAEAQALFYEGHTNNASATYYNQVGVITGTMEVYTSRYLSSTDWLSAVDPSSGTGGLVVEGGSGDNHGATIINIPSVDIPFIGLAVTTP